MMPIIQNTFTSRPDIAVPGTFTEAFEKSRRVSGKVSRGLHKAGLMTFKAPTVGGAGANSMLSPGIAFQNPTPAIAVDVDAIVAAHVVVLAAGSLSGTGLDGLIGGGLMTPARNVTITLNASTDWAAGNWTITGVNSLGQTVTDTIAAVADIAQTLTSTSLFQSVSSIGYPASDAVTTGSFTVGVSALSAGLTLADALGVVVRDPLKTGVFTANLYGYPGVTATGYEANYVNNDTLPVLSHGGIWVITEEAVKDQDPVFVRIAAGAGGSQLGAFRNDADGGSCVVVGGRFTRDSASGLAPASIQMW